MERAKEDRRVRRTRKLLKQGLSELMAEKDFKDISVKDITERMDLNRGTFYLHYTDIYDLLNKIESDVLDDFQKMIDKHLPRTNNDTLMPIIEPIVGYIAENADICKILFLNNASYDFSLKFKNLIITNGQSLIPERFGTASSTSILNYFLNFTAYGIMGMIKEWLSNVDSIEKKDIIALSDKILSAYANEVLTKK